MEHGTGIDLDTFFEVLRRRRLKILSVALIAAGLVLAASLAQSDKFEASSELLFRQSHLAETFFNSNSGNSGQQAPEREAATNLALASLDVVSERVRSRLGLKISADKLRAKVKVEPKGQADIVKIIATADTRQQAVAIANAFAVEAVQFRKQTAQAQVQDAIDVVKQQAATDQGQARADLDRRIRELTVLKALQTGDVEVIQSARPPRDRSAPKPLRNTIIGGIVGLILGIFLAFLLHRLDRRVRDEDELGRILDAPILARIPADRGSAQHMSQSFFESFQFLRANLQVQAGVAEARVIAVTSPLPSDGKTTVVAHLARAFGLIGVPVIAADCDLRKPSLHRSFGISRGEGVSEVLVEGVDPVPLLRTVVEPGVRVLRAGRTNLTAASIVIAMNRVPRMLERLDGEAEYILVDTPPVSVAADASAVAPVVDGVLLVVDLERVRRDALIAVRDQLAQSRARLLGIVLNRADHPVGKYEYSSYGREAEAEPEVDGDSPERARLARRT
jgi:capsular exopolysaccharide synthesis family protein